jgi:aryl-alcohol dehydrogenase-like predicted oxidoreductase
MHYRNFSKDKHKISEIGYGMWGLAGWTGTDQTEVQRALDRSVELGVNFFDTAWGYGAGKSEQILGALLRQHRHKQLFVATKIPPMNFKWPSLPEYQLKDCFPAHHIIEYTEKSLKNLGVEQIDLQQFHVWNDTWHDQDDWKNAIEKLTKQGKVAQWGVSVNRWEPDNVLDTLRTGLIDAVQVIYNIFDQAPEDNLFPLCKALDVSVIARVPFDEGTLTGMLTHDTTFPADDWRATYFVPENLHSSVDHADALRPLIPNNMTMAEMALRFILSTPDSATIIPGMRSVRHVESNCAASDGRALSADLMMELKKHRWDRERTEWSQ